MPTPTLLLLAGDDALLARSEAALRADEREVLAGYTFEKRRKDWLLGRIAGKLAVCRALGMPEAPERVAITAEPNGHPVATVDGAPLSGLDVSLTHGHEHAAALVAPAAVGIDLERLRAVPPGGWRFFLTPVEREWLAGEPLGPHGEIVAWALKEAAYKAVQGRTRGIHHLTLDEVGAGRARIGHEGPEGTLAARYAVGERFCLAIATPAGVAPAWFQDLALPPPASL